MTKRILPALLAAACLWSVLPQARAAEGYGNCTGFIDALPATIVQQGVWCLRQDVATGAGDGGAAITVATNNATIDCNHHGLERQAAAGFGIRADNRQNVTVRNCRIRGFTWGMYLYGGAGHLVEDNLVERSDRYGIELRQVGDGVVRRNRVLETGAGTDNENRTGIRVSVDEAGWLEVRDNVVQGVRGTPGYYNTVLGIYLGGAAVGGQVVGNRVAGLAPTGTDRHAYGIRAQELRNGAVAGNQVHLGVADPGSYGILCGTGTSLRDNGIRGFGNAFSGCQDDGGNAVH